MAQNNGNNAPVPPYFIEWTEPALAEADSTYLWLSVQAGPEYAANWYENLFVAAQGLSSMPRLHPIAPENEHYDVEVRRLLYRGPSRRSATPYRILFYIVEPDAEGEQGLVRILHVWHGARQPGGEQ